jgi:hypothetical protein
MFCNLHFSPREYLWVYIIARINSDYFPEQHKTCEPCNCYELMRYVLFEVRNECWCIIQTSFGSTLLLMLKRMIVFLIFQINKALNLSVVLWVMTQCGLVCVDERFVETYHLSLQGGYYNRHSYVFLVTVFDKINLNDTDYSTVGP